MGPHQRGDQAGRMQPAKLIVMVLTARQEKGRCGTSLRFVSSLGLRPSLDLPVVCGPGNGIGPFGLAVHVGQSGGDRPVAFG